MRQKTTVCIVCGEENKKMHGRYCHSCDYKRNIEWFNDRHDSRKLNGYYEKHNSHYRKDCYIAKKYYGQVCMKCGFYEEPGILQVHHKDRNRKNHDISNLIILCPNCHILIHFQEKTGLFSHHKGAISSQV